MTNSKRYTIGDVISDPDATCPGPFGVVAYFKSYAEGPTAYAGFGDPFWKKVSDVPCVYTVFYPVYGGGCTYKEWECVIVQKGQILSTSIKTEQSVCPSPQAPIKNSVLKYKIVDPGAAFKRGDFLMDYNKFAQWEVTDTYWHTGVDDDGNIIPAADGVKWVKMIDGGSDYSVGEQVTVGSNENSDFPNPNRRECVIEITAVTDAEYT